MFFFEALNYITKCKRGWGQWVARLEVIKNAVKSGSLIIRLGTGLAGGKIFLFNQKLSGKVRLVTKKLPLDNNFLHGWWYESCYMYCAFDSF